MKEKLSARINSSWLSIPERDRKILEKMKLEKELTVPHETRRFKAAPTFVAMNKLIFLDKALKPSDICLLAYIAACDMTKSEGDEAKEARDQRHPLRLEFSPVRVTNDHLTEWMGVTHPTLQQIKKRCCRRGWLEIKPGSKKGSRYYQSIPIINTPEQLINEFNLGVSPAIRPRLQDLLIDLNKDDKKKGLLCKLSYEAQEDFRLFFIKYEYLVQKYYKKTYKHPFSSIPGEALKNYHSEKELRKKRGY
jgi:hypothetical protein